MLWSGSLEKRKRLTKVWKVCPVLIPKHPFSLSMIPFLLIFISISHLDISMFLFSHESDSTITVSLQNCPTDFWSSLASTLLHWSSWASGSSFFTIPSFITPDRQSDYKKGQKEMLFQGLSVGGFSWFKRISSSFYSVNLLLYDRVAFLIWLSLT